MMQLFAFLLVFLSFVSIACGEEASPQPAADTQSQATAPGRIDFAHEIVPILKLHCVKCHAGQESEGDLSINTRESLLKSKAVVPGKSGESELIARIIADDPDVRMPPEEDPLTAEQIAKLRRWVDEGAKYDDGFSFAGKQVSSLPLALTSPQVPPAAEGREHPVDRLVAAYFAKREAPFPPAVDDATFARRVYLDLIGLLPTPAELQAFLDDPSADKRERLIDQLLNRNVDYADHWFTFWSDLLRNDYQGTGYIDGGRKQITTWLYDALLNNMPYDQFVRELISPSSGSEGFIKGFKWRGNVNASQTTEMQFSQNVAQVFLGINLKCASCHDSFVSEWKLADAYNLAAITAEKPLELHRCDVPQGTFAKPGFLFDELGEIDGSLPREERLAQLAHLITDPRNGRLPRTIVNRIWHRLMGRGIVHPVDAMDSDPWSADVLDYLAGYLVENDYDVQRLLKHIATSQIYQARCVPPNESSDGAPAFDGPIAKRLTAEQYIDAIWRITEAKPPKMAAKVSDRNGAPLRSSLVVSDLLMRSLGRPNRDQVMTTRPEELSMLEALDLTNGQMMSDYVSEGAKKFLAEGKSADAEQLATKIYLSALSREPTAEELKSAREMLGQPVNEDGLADFLWCVFVLPEFQLVK